MNNKSISIFLASIFAEFEGLRSTLTKQFSTTTINGLQFRLLAWDSCSKGKPPVVEFCLEQAKNADVFILLIGKTYPERGTGPDGKSVTHAEYEAALKSKTVRRIFVFLTHDEYKDQGVNTSVNNIHMAKLLETVKVNANRFGHLVLTLPFDDNDKNAEWIYSHITSTLNNDKDIYEHSTKELSVQTRLEAILMQSDEKDNLDLKDALRRLEGANSIAKENFKDRLVPKEAYSRKLFRTGDSRMEKISDFEKALHDAAGFGKVLCIVSPSGQGKSTFVSSFPEKYCIPETDCVFLTGREMETRKYEQHLLDVALVAKMENRIYEQHLLDAALVEKNSATEINRRYLFLIVDALNECSQDLLPEIVVWLQELFLRSNTSQWPIKIILTMRPDVANTIPELSPYLVRRGNTYDMEPFGRLEYLLCAKSHELQTSYDTLPPSLKEHLRDPLLLGMVGKTYEKKTIPLENSDLDIFSDYLFRLTKNVSNNLNNQTDSLINQAEIIAGNLLTFGLQTLNNTQLDNSIGKDLASQLVSVGILADVSQQCLDGVTKRYGFRYDRVAEYCMGRYIKKNLQEIQSRHNNQKAILDTLVKISSDKNYNSLAELHWAGITLGLHFYLLEHYEREGALLIHLMHNIDVRWRMVARGVFVKLYGVPKQDKKENEKKAFRYITNKIIEYAHNNRSDREFHAELISIAFEVISTEYNNSPDKKERNDDIEMLLKPICEGLTSTDQEIANLVISSLSLLFAHNEHIPSIARQLSLEIEMLDLGLWSLIRKQVNLRASPNMKSFLGKLRGNRLISVPVFSVVKLLVMCFASSLDDNGRKASLTLLSLLLKRLRNTILGGTLQTTFGKNSAMFLLSTLLEIILRKNLMPINAKEWKQLVNNTEQYEAFKNAVRLLDPNVFDFETEKVIAQIVKPSPNPFMYQTLLTALSTKFELANNGHIKSEITEKIIDIIKKIIDKDIGNGTAKYISSLVLYHINTFGNYGNIITAKLMTELASDILKHHDGCFGDRINNNKTLYNSNIIGTTGRSLIKLSDRSVNLEEDAFGFIRSQIHKIKNDPYGEFTKYIIDNLALLAVLLPENLAILRLINDEIYWPARKSLSGPAILLLDKWVIDAFVRIRSVHPIAVDSFLSTRNNTDMFYSVRSEHARKILEGDMQGLDGELVSWAFERIFFELTVHSREFSSRVNSVFCKYLDSSPKLKSEALVQLGLICMEEGFAWAEAFEANASNAGVKVTRTP